jgi:dephospho-CoA kinase
MIICVLGRSGSGKSYICELLKAFSKNIVHIDVDKIGHDSLKNPIVKKSIIDTFGNRILNENEIDRKKLGKIVFDSEEQMDKLTEITWGYMEKTIDNYIQENNNKIVLLDWQLLMKSKFFKMSDLNILVKSSIEMRMKKAIIRDNITEEEFLLREKAGYQFNEIDFDYVIENDYTENTKIKVKEIYEKNIISRKF